MKIAVGDIDRRKNKRFKVPADTFVIVKNPKFRIGQIIDMSESGLAFFHMDTRLLSEKFKIDILLADNDFYLDKIQVNKVSDITIEKDPLMKNSTMKRCGLQFADLTETQKSKLACFIPKHGNGFVQDRRCTSDSRE